MAEIPSIEGYTDLTRVARGGFAVVYRARQERFDRVVALKVLSVDEIDERARKRFERECRVMGSLSWHPNVVAVLDSGVADGHPWLAMEFLDAGALSVRLDRDGGLPWQEVADIGIQVAGALGAAHASGVLHRDLKPENLLVGPFGETKLADFGIAAVEGGTRTTTGSASFTVAHVAPEILEGRAPDERADVYGLASTLHTLITGSPPFSGQGEESIATLITRILQAPAPRLVGVPEGLADLVVSAMAKSPDDRPQTAEAFGRALQDIQAEQSLTPTALRLAPTSASATGATPVPLDAAATVAGPETDDAAATVAGPETDDAAATVAGPDAGAPTRGHAEDPDQAATIARRRTDEVPPSATAAPTGASVDTTTPSAEAHRSRRTPVLRTVGAIVAVAVVVAVLVVVVVRKGKDDPAGPPEVTATIAVGEDPIGILATDATIWVSTYADNSVDRIDPGDNEVTDTTLEGNGPQGITSTDGAVWVGNYSDGTLDRVDPDTGEVTDTVELSGSPQDVSGLDGTVWVAMLDDAVIGVDADSLAVSDPITVSGGPQTIAATADAVWVTALVNDTVVRIDPDTGEVTATIPVDGGPEGVAATDDAVWVTLPGNGTVVRIDPDTEEVTATIPVGAEPRGITATDDGVWLTNAADGTAMRIDPDTNEVTDTVTVGPDTGRISAADGTVWVANGDNTVSRIDRT